MATDLHLKTTQNAVMRQYPWEPIHKRLQAPWPPAETFTKLKLRYDQYTAAAERAINNKHCSRPSTALDN